MDEFSLIDELIAPRAGSRSDVVLGIGDDGAIVRPPPGEELVVVVDTLVEGVHFPRELAPPDLGFRAAAVNLSDIAAMGAEPRWATLALTLPVAREDWLAEFMCGMQEALSPYRVQLIGGDTTRGPLTITLQLIGSVPTGQALTRHGARPGDEIYVSGTLGDAAGGLLLYQQQDHDFTPSDARQFLRERFARPSARVALGLALRGVATSAIDVSDGLLADLGHIASRSGCAAQLELERIPLSPSLKGTQPLTVARRLALTGGDDYELCFTVPVGRSLAVRAARTGIPLEKIGVMVVGHGEVTVRDETGQRFDFVDTGYRHF